MRRKIKMAIVGGGQGSFIGPVHIMAAQLDGQIELVAGAFSSDAENSHISGEKFFLDPKRAYSSYQEMLQAEANLPDGIKADFIAIVTPNFLHYPVAKLALELGFHVVCDKPLCFELEEAKELERLAKEKNLHFAVTYNYTGYPMVRQARYMVAEGKLGKLRKVQVEYTQGWLSELVEATGRKQAAWRTDPSKNGPAGGMGDIGTHAASLAETIIGSGIHSVSAWLNSFGEGRTLDDDGAVRLKFSNGVLGTLQASQISNGEENRLSIRLYGEKGGLEWHQQEPNTLIFKSQEQVQILRTGKGDLCEEAQLATRLPAGHPEGYLEGFGNIYKYFALHLRNRLFGENNALLPYPTASEGKDGVAFLTAVLNSAQHGGNWTNL